MDRDQSLNYLKGVLSIKDTRYDGDKNYIPNKTHIFMPMTYITPNYTALFSLSTIAALTRQGNYVSILLHDNNLIMHNYVLKNRAIVSQLTAGVYTQHLIEEITRILKIFNADDKKVRILKTSELWAKIMQDSSLNLDFYTILGGLSISVEDIESGLYEVAYHIIERAFDMYISKNYQKIVEQGLPDPVFFMINQRRVRPYERIRDIIYGSEIKNNNRNMQYIISLKDIPYIIHDDLMPSCTMSFSDIKKLFELSKLDSRQEAMLKKNFMVPISQILNRASQPPRVGMRRRDSDKGSLVFEFYALMHQISALLNEQKIESLHDITVSSMIQLESVAKVLSSKKALQIMSLCDGEMTMSEIAKKTNTQLSNTSSYISLLRTLGFVSTGKRPMIRVSSLIIPTKLILNRVGNFSVKFTS